MLTPRWQHRIFHFIYIDPVCFFCRMRLEEQRRRWRREQKKKRIQDLLGPR